MDDRFEQEVYKSEWQRVLPLGPHGIAPLIQTSRRSGPPAPAADLGRWRAKLGALGRRTIAFGRLATVGMAKLLLATDPRADRQRASPRCAPETAHPAEHRAAMPRRLVKAA